MLVYFSLFLFFLVVLKFNSKNSYKDLVLESVLTFSVFIVFITEVLSQLKSLSLVPIIVIWSSISIALLIVLLKDRKGTFASIINFKSKISVYYKSSKIYEKGLIWFTIIGLFALLFQGIIYPPNNWDSLTYHMSRIMYWISNESVSHFQTTILRNLYQPPFTEYFILNINQLNGNDYLSNSVELFFLAQVLVVVYAILGLFNTPRFLKLLALLLVITIPAIELQSTTTKNDIVCAFFIFSAIYFILKSVKSNSLKDYFFIGIAVGLALLTKGTAYIFLAPVLFSFGISEIYKLWIGRNSLVIRNCFVSIILAFLINIGHYSRNYPINHSIISIDDTESKNLANESMDGKLLFSNLIKNAGLHLGFPIRKPADELVRGIHEKLNIPIDDKRINYLSLPYEGARNTTHEDYAPNTLVFLLAIISFGVIIFSSLTRKPYNKVALITVLIIFAQILLFAAYLKWQPWHTRLHIPIFIFCVISIIWACQMSKRYKQGVMICIPIMACSFVFYYLYNNVRPIVNHHKYTKTIKISDSRFKKYFANQPDLYKEYSTILNEIYDENPKKIGLNLDDWEYPLLHSFYYDHVELISVNVYNITKKIEQDEANIDLIVSNKNTPFILINGIEYKNQNNTNLHIWLYKK